MKRKKHKSVRHKQGLAPYEKIVGREKIDEIYKKARKFRGKHLLAINSTFAGGGVAEILDDAVTLFNRIGIDFGWRVLHAKPTFFNVTKKIHNALQGEKLALSKQERETYLETNQRFSEFTHIANHHDLVVVHDPQPLPIILFYKKTQPWIFRFHLDISMPDHVVWNYLKQYAKKYDHIVVSRDEYKKNDLSVPQSVIHPAIDPLSPKNSPLSAKKCARILDKFGIRSDKPIISQVSRFDKWKDPVGVIKIFEMAREKTDCRLVLLGSFATDDPEGQKMYESVESQIKNCRYRKDIHLVCVSDDMLVNVVQRSSAVVIQKSIREGFALTVSEALFKGTPVVASRIGGIPLQVKDGENGFLHDPRDTRGFAGSVIKLLADEELRKSFGKRGREHIKNNFLITRLLLDWLKLFEQYI